VATVAVVVVVVVVVMVAPIPPGLARSPAAQEWGPEMEAAIALVKQAGSASRMKYHRKAQAAAKAKQPNGTP
jgi:hypothetical protein